MKEQMKIVQDGRIAGDHAYKVEMAIERLKAFEPPDGYYVAFSGGKDSQCIYHLCQMAGVKFDAHYSVTSVDPPELIRFIREHYPDVEWTRQHYSDGKPEHYYPDGRPKPITMWSLIADHTLPPTRKMRYCCAALKEPGGGISNRGHRRAMGREHQSAQHPRGGERAWQAQDDAKAGGRHGSQVQAQ